MLNRLRKCWIGLSIAVAMAGAYASDFPLPTKVTIGETEREWHLFMPPNGGKQLPLVIDLHGTGGSPESQSMLSQFARIAVQESFLVVWPQGRYLGGSYQDKHSWNSDLFNSIYDDVSFIRELINEVEKVHQIDRKRVYVAGFSAGARMASRLACELSDKIAAIGPVGGVQYPTNCSFGRPIPVISFHGRQDAVIDFERSKKAIVAWSERNKCSLSPDVEKFADTVSKLTYSGCENGVEVVLYESTDGGHTWPGSSRAQELEELGLGKTNKKLPMSALMWQFFKAYKLP